jgi:hypothetical protein
MLEKPKSGLYQDCPVKRSVRVISRNSYKKKIWEKKTNLHAPRSLFLVHQTQSNHVSSLVKLRQESKLMKS